MDQDLKLEAVVIPVSDVDRAKEFYLGLGWRLDADFPFDNGFRVVQLTPPGSPCSVQFGTDITSAAPGSAEGLYLIVSDAEKARAELVARGADASEVFHPGSPGAQFRADEGDRLAGPADDRASYSTFVTFTDPDGNRWLLQEVTTRLPGRVDPTETSYADVADLAAALRRAAAAHGEHEARNGGEYDENWPDWYAEYMGAELAGTELPT
ncbi:MAG TPA: VOC family protein [Nocardioides sp.]|uniref:VOC family protein n=1 Tax=Nocardioides sp. TaxID=35761 RepID=UPI002E367738|nr:VOC family protein [Nocardioides sp.]HEX5090138.1 VOC family protein [Nocardioides sp.]